MTDTLGPFELGKVHCMDCVEAMKRLPDKCVDAVVTDPPYGVQITKSNRLSVSRGRGGEAWDATPPPPSAFADINRISRNQIIWGGHYFGLGRTRGYLIWDKRNDGRDFGEVEFAWTSLDMVPRIFHKRPQGMDGGKLHTTQKPLGVMVWCLGWLGTNGIIIDPFAGSGTTGVACVKLGRQFLGFEIDPEYCRLANERIAAAEKGVTLKEHRTGQEALFS